MSAIDRYSRASLYGLMLGGLMAGCTTADYREVPVPEVIPAQTCGGNVDSDGDGITNCNDRCPGTLAGQAVDPDGCPLPVVVPMPFRG